MTIAESFETMVTLFNPNAAAGLNKTFQWNVSGDEAGVYALKVENGTVELVKGGVEKPDVTFNVSDKDWLAIAEGKLDPMNAFMSGRVKLTGDMMLAMRVQNLFPVRR